MTIQVDNHSPPPPVAAPAAGRSAGAARYVHPATRVTVRHSTVPLFDVIVDPVAGRLDLVGEFDLACGQRFREGSAALLAGDAHDVVVDLTRLRFIDASAIGILIELANALAAREAALRIINADARIGRVFSACRLDAMLSGRDRP